jgi:hypothetical protein
MSVVILRKLCCFWNFDINKAVRDNTVSNDSVNIQVCFVLIVDAGLRSQTKHIRIITWWKFSNKDEQLRYKRW